MGENWLGLAVAFADPRPQEDLGITVRNVAWTGRIVADGDAGTRRVRDRVAVRRWVRNGAAGVTWYRRLWQIIRLTVFHCHSELNLSFHPVETEESKSVRKMSTTLMCPQYTT